VVSRQNADIAGTLHLRDVVMASIFWLSIYGGAHWRHLVKTTEPSVWRRCGHTNYFDHLFVIMTFMYTKVAFLMPCMNCMNCIMEIQISWRRALFSW